MENSLCFDGCYANPTLKLKKNPQILTFIMIAMKFYLQISNIYVGGICGMVHLATFKQARKPHQNMSRSSSIIHMQCPMGSGRKGQSTLHEHVPLSQGSANPRPKPRHTPTQTDHGKLCVIEY